MALDYNERLFPIEESRKIKKIEKIKNILWLEFIVQNFCVLNSLILEAFHKIS